MFYREVEYRTERDLHDDRDEMMESLEAKLENDDLNILERAKLQ